MLTSVFRKRLGAALLFCVLFASFAFNIFHVADKGWFGGFQADSDLLVWGRFTATKQEGFFSHAGMLGSYGQSGIAFDQILARQIDVYEGKRPPTDWSNYDPQMGLQGLLLGALIPNSLPPTNVFFVGRLLASGLSAGVLTGFLLWLAAEMGIAALIAATIGIVLSPWMTVFGKSVYWMMGTLFLPMAVMAWGLKAEADPKPKDRKSFLWVYLFLAFFIKSACGYEYLSAVVLATWSIVVFYAVRDQWRWRYFLRVSIAVGLSSIAAFLISFGITMLQDMIAHSYDLSDGLTALWQRASVRFGATPPGYVLDPNAVTGSTISRVALLKLYGSNFLGGPAGHAPFTFGNALLLGLVMVLWGLFGDHIEISAQKFFKRFSFFSEFAPPTRVTKNQRRPQFALAAAVLAYYR